MLLTPSIIQLAHTLENHKHAVCISDDIAHVHEKDIDCSILHRQLQTFSIDFSSNHEVIPPQFYTNTFTLKPQVKEDRIAFKKTTRGPPSLIV